MKTNENIGKYIENNVLTANPENLILMLYNSCLKNISEAKSAVRARDYENANRSVQKAQDIIGELSSSLDTSYEMASNILKLYAFINQVLVDANIEKNTDKLDLAAKFVNDFRTTWVSVMEICKRESKSSIAG